jgi:hypothetical protein
VTTLLVLLVALAIAATIRVTFSPERRACARSGGRLVCTPGPPETVCRTSADGVVTCSLQRRPLCSCAAPTASR